MVDMERETQVRLPDPLRSDTESAINPMQDDTFEPMGFSNPDTVLSTASDGTLASRLGDSLPTRFAGRGSLSVELYPTDSSPQISPSGRLAQMNLDDDYDDGGGGGSAISPIIPEFCPLGEEEEGDGCYEYSEVMFPSLGDKT